MNLTDELNYALRQSVKMNRGGMCNSIQVSHTVGAQVSITLWQVKHLGAIVLLWLWFMIIVLNLCLSGA